MPVNPTNVIKLLQKHFSYINVSTELNAAEKETATALINILSDASAGIDFVWEEEELIDIDSPCEEEEDEEYLFDVEEEAEPFVPAEEERHREISGRGQVVIVTEAMLQEALNYYRGTSIGTRKLSSMHNRFAWIEGDNELKWIRA